MLTRWFLRCLVPVVVATTGTQSDAAEPSPSDRALATQLFNEARQLVADGRHEDACPRFAESQRLDPGGGTLLNLALCHEAIGLTATAWAELHEAMAIAERDGRSDREELARERATALEPRLSRLVVDVPPPADVPDLVVMRNGSPLPRVVWGSATPIDPGEVEIEASAPGRTPWSTIITIGPEADRQTITIPELDLAPVPEPHPDPPELPLPAPAVSLPPVVSKIAEPPLVDRDTLRTTGLVVGCTGVASLAAGIALGVHAIATRKESDAECIEGCNHRGAALSIEAVRAADASTATLIIGGLALGTGAFMVLWSLGDDDEGAQIAVGPLTTALRTTW